MTDTVVSGFTVADLAKRWRIGEGKIHGFLRRGELIGVNLATHLSARPQWRITPEAVEQFERRRSSAPPPRPPRRRKQPLVIDFYPDTPSDREAVAS
jgi:hypothetical protein